jgi:phosphonate transport system substrate-binding protein
MKSLKSSMLIPLLVVGVLVLSACGGGASEPTSVPAEPPPPAETAAPATATSAPLTATAVPETPTPEPTPTPEGPAPGTAENPLVIAATDVSGFGFHQVVSGLLAEETGFTVESPAFPSDTELVQYLASGETPDVIISFPGGYLVANKLYGYEVALMGTQLGGQLTYTAQVIAGADTGVASLADLAGRSICWGNPDFLAGYKVQRLMLWAEGIDPDTDLGQATQMMTQDQVATAVYNGDCEVGTVAEGAISRLERQHPDAATKVVVIAESPPIPSLGLSFAPGLPDDVKTAVIDGYRAVYARSGNDGAQALSMGYGWESVDDVDDALYDPLRQLIMDAKVEADELL